MLNNFLYSLNATLPVFAVMVLGWLLKRRNFLSDDFLEKVRIYRIQATERLIQNQNLRL